MTLIENSTKVNSYLPIFSGFYNTLWDCDTLEDSEIEYINDERTAKGKTNIDSIEIDFDYKDYRNQVGKYLTEKIGETLKENGFISEITFDEIVSPKEYNFANDSIYVNYHLTDDNQKEIKKFLFKHFEDFEDYIKENYTSYDGFISFHSNKSIDWLIDNNLLEDQHKLGAIFNFILDMNEVCEQDLYMDAESFYLSVINFDECLTMDSNEDLAIIAQNEWIEFISYHNINIQSIRMFSDYGTNPNQLELKF